MKDKKNILDELKKRQQPEVPEGFFEEFSEKMASQVSEEELSFTEVSGNEDALDGLQKTTKPEVPEGFFENFSAEISEKVQSEQTVQEKPTRILSLKIVGFVTAVAACLLVMFYIMPDNNTNEQATNDTDSIDTVQAEQLEPLTDEDYLAYLDEDDFINFIVDNEDIELEETLDEELEELTDEDMIYYLEDEDLDDLYFDEL